jgi:hypothetical protein
MSVSFNPIKLSVSFLNNPAVKNGIKSVAGVAAFAFGVWEIYDNVIDLKEAWQNRKRGPLAQQEDFSWQKTTLKATVVMARISLVLSCLTSKPGAAICSWTGGRVFPEARLLQLFGPNTIFAVNPYHPRHIANIAACVLGLPALIKSVVEGGEWVTRKFVAFCDRSSVQSSNSVGAGSMAGATDVRIQNLRVQLTASFNTLFSRTTLHSVNQWARVFK